MKTFKIASLFAIMTMIFNAILFTIYDKSVEGYINTKYLALTSLLGFFSGFLAHYSILMIGMSSY